MSKSVKIYCEGKKGSHDYDLLEKVIAGLGGSIKIEPIGSIRGAGAIIQYKEENDVDRADFKLLFRDRDFDKAIPATPMLEQDEQRKYCYFAYRNTIENYLFDTNLLFEFLREKGLMQKYAIQTVEDARKALIHTAKSIRYYQAVRHTMGKMRTGDTNFGTKWVVKSGILPENLEENYLKNKALEKINNAKLVAESWTEAEFDKFLSAFLAKFDDTFFDNFEFLVWFQGKDLATAIQQLLPNFPIVPYYKYAKLKFDYTQFEDLKQLRLLIEQNL